MLEVVFLFLLFVFGLFFLWLAFGLLLLFPELLELLDPLGLIVIDFFNRSTCGLLDRWLNWSFLNLLCSGLVLLLLDQLLSLLVLTEEISMLLHILVDDLKGLGLSRVEVGLPSHEGEEVVEEVLNALALLDGGHEESIKSWVFHLIN